MGRARRSRAGISFPTDKAAPPSPLAMAMAGTGEVCRRIRSGTVLGLQSCGSVSLPLVDFWGILWYQLNAAAQAKVTDGNVTFARPAERRATPGHTHKPRRYSRIGGQGLARPNTGYPTANTIPRNTLPRPRGLCLEGHSLSVGSRRVPTPTSREPPQNKWMAVCRLGATTSRESRPCLPAPPWPDTAAQTQYAAQR
ncbi:hypothetical protein BOTBODRAFT_270810 [Botryobasidium botryosum FD-172 SS1]|uniref:Uncharacterized protein n=1 Tax=Botryobasidium botryosum (strain FD-172 SS1) TaxID=930990 RepID=A0A067M3B9_BOTB1|nr:hypothetical protein BOTBODRAFT_270810 [Botryobasidium botryosum FD-172 SS1]